MKSIGVLMTIPMPSNLAEKLATRFTLFKLWNYPSIQSFSESHAGSVRAFVCDAKSAADAKTIDALPNLEIVSTYSVGFDKIDIGKCRERGIRVTNTPDVLTDDVADLAIGLALAVFRKIPNSDGFVKNGLWKCSDYPLTTKFSGKKVGIVGLGRIGSAIAKRAAAFGCPISYHSRTQKPEAGSYKYYPNILDLAANSQVLVVACALTEQTRHIVNRGVIDALGPKGVIVNIGRGPIIDEPELVSALVEGRLGGAGLDVFENEPDVPEELLSLENVVLTPHVGTDTEETCKDMADLVIANLEAHFSGKPLLTPVL